MTGLITRVMWAAGLAAAMFVAQAASAQEAGSPLSAIGRIFGQQPSGVAQTTGQESTPTTDQVLRIEQLEAQVRQMTGTIEQLQYRNQQLENQIRSMGGAVGTQPSQQPGQQPGQQAGQQAQSRPQPPAAPPPVASSPVQTAPVPAPVVATAPPPPAGTAAERQADVFDPSLHPNAPGAPRPLGSPQHEPPPPVSEERPIGAPGGRGAGAPLDLSNLSSSPAVEPRQGGPLPPPPSRNPSATGAVAAVAPPSSSPRDAYDLAYGYVLHKDYALAEESFRGFLKRFPNDKRVVEAKFWIGESLFQRQRYEQAAQAFLDLSTKHGSHPKAPEALLRLAQSLDAMKQKEMACATLAEVGRKYPKAPLSVKRGVEREQKRARC